MVKVTDGPSGATPDFGEGQTPSLPPFCNSPLLFGIEELKGIETELEQRSQGLASAEALDYAPLLRRLREHNPALLPEFTEEALGNCDPYTAEEFITALNRQVLLPGERLCVFEVKGGNLTVINAEVPKSEWQPMDYIPGLQVFVNRSRFEGSDSGCGAWVIDGFVFSDPRRLIVNSAAKFERLMTAESNSLGQYGEALRRLITRIELPAEDYGKFVAVPKEFTCYVETAKNNVFARERAALDPLLGSNSTTACICREGSSFISPAAEQIAGIDTIGEELAARLSALIVVMNFSIGHLRSDDLAYCAFLDFMHDAEVSRVVIEEQGSQADSASPAVQDFALEIVLCSLESRGLGNFAELTEHLSSHAKGPGWAAAELMADIYRANFLTIPERTALLEQLRAGQN